MNFIWNKKKIEINFQELFISIIITLTLTNNKFYVN